MYALTEAAALALTASGAVDDSVYRIALCGEQVADYRRVGARRREDRVNDIDITAGELVSYIVGE